MSSKVISIVGRIAATRGVPKAPLPQVHGAARDLRRVAMSEAEVINRFVAGSAIRAIGIYHPGKHKGAEQALRDYIINRLPQRPIRRAA